jgi:hypothetical protein
MPTFASVGTVVLLFSCFLVDSLANQVYHEWSNAPVQYSHKEEHWNGETGTVTKFSDVDVISGTDSLSTATADLQGRFGASGLESSMTRKSAPSVAPINSRMLTGDQTAWPSVHGNDGAPTHGQPYVSQQTLHPSNEATQPTQHYPEPGRPSPSDGEPHRMPLQGRPGPGLSPSAPAAPVGSRAETPGPTRIPSSVPTLIPTGPACTVSLARQSMEGNLQLEAGSTVGAGFHVNIPAPGATVVVRNAVVTLSYSCINNAPAVVLILIALR